MALHMVSQLLMKRYLSAICLLFSTVSGRGPLASESQRVGTGGGVTIQFTSEKWYGLEAVHLYTNGVSVQLQHQTNKQSLEHAAWSTESKMPWRRTKMRIGGGCHVTSSLVTPVS